jgi:hypothetical protein
VLDQATIGSTYYSNAYLNLTLTNTTVGGNISAFYLYELYTGDGNLRLLTLSASITGGDITIDGEVDALYGVDLDASGSVNLNNDVFVNDGDS